MTHTTPVPKEDAPAIAIVILLIGIFGVSQGLSFPLFSLILERQGVDSTLIGLSSAMTPLGIIASAPLLPRITRLCGSGWLALLSTIALAALFAAIGAYQNLWFWFPSRFLLGFATSGIYVTSETWINVLVAPARRGRILGIFAAVLSFGFACGPFILVGTGSAGWAPFLAGIAVVLIGALLLGAVFRRLPNIGASGKGSILAFAKIAPALLLVVGAVAAYDQTILALFPIYGSGKALTEHEIALAITVWASGNILFQVPIGYLSDRWSRRGTTALLGTITVAGAIGLPFVIRSPSLLWALMFVWGPASYGVYTVALIELGEGFSGIALLAGNSAFAAMWGLGGLGGPPLVGALMDWFGPESLPVALALIYVLLLASVAVRRKP